MADQVQDSDFIQLGMDAASYDKLEQDFKRVLDEMVGEKSMDRFRTEYERLHRALRTSYENEKRLFKRCKDMNESITNNAARVKGAIKLTQEDASTITVLKREVDKAWKLVEKAKEKEESARKIITDLKQEIAHLHKIVTSGSGLSFSQDNAMQQVLNEKQQLKDEFRQKMEHIVELEQSKVQLLD